MIKEIIKKNYIMYYYLLLIIRYANVLRFKIFTNYDIKIKKKSNLNIFDFMELSKDLPLNSKYLYKENTMYGNDKAASNALNQDLKINDYIEHGYYFGNHIQDGTFSISSRVITYGPQRVKHLEAKFKESNECEKNKNIITIGPYINYADSVLDENEKLKIKSDYGKVLLVFPSHSIEGVIYKYNTQDFILEIEKISKDFDSVFVCMYWKDIQDGRYSEYENKGFKIVTAGHRNDPNFLGRLKDIIDFSDMTMSNTVGTHVGYCVSRNKPHYLFNQFQEVEGEKVDEEFKERNNQEYLRTRDEEVNEVIEAFSKLSYIITAEQKYVIEKYWGKNEVKYYTITKKGIENDKKNF